MLATPQTQTAITAAEDLRRGFAKISADLQAGTTLRSTSPASMTSELPFLNKLRDVLAAAPKAAWPRLSISFNEDQVESKLWLLRHLPTATLSTDRVVILGAWYGLLALMLNRLAAKPPSDICCIDIDEETCALATHVLSVLPTAPEVRQEDMMTIDYPALTRGRPTIVVNTSCEHLADFAGWRARVPSGTRLVLQSNNHRGCSEHVGCVPDLETFESEARLTTVDYRGVLPLKNFNRFMLIGAA